MTKDRITPTVSTGGRNAGKTQAELSRLANELNKAKAEIARLTIALAGMTQLIENGRGVLVNARKEEQAAIDGLMAEFIAEFMDDSHFCWKVLEAIRKRIRERRQA